MVPDDAVFICSDLDEIANPDKLNDLVSTVEETLARL
jgi:hypothetical protein